MHMDDGFLAIILKGHSLFVPLPIAYYLILVTFVLLAELQPCASMGREVRAG